MFETVIEALFGEMHKIFTDQYSVVMEERVINDRRQTMHLCRLQDKRWTMGYCGPDRMVLRHLHGHGDEERSETCVVVSGPIGSH